MFVGPVFSVELVTSARRVRYFIWRVAYAMLLLVVMGCIYLAVFGFAGANTIDAAASFARAFLVVYAFVQLGAVMVLGPAIAAGAISQERERRTIEYLFTTHLTNSEIVLSKVAAAVVQLTVAVLVGMPVLALALLLGGVTPEELIAVFLITVSTIVATVSLSLVASVHARRARESVAATYIVLFIITVGPFLADLVFRRTAAYTWMQPVLSALIEINPLVVLDRLLDNSQAAASLAGTADDRWNIVWGNVAIHLAFSAVCVIWSAWSLRRVHLEARVATAGGQETRYWHLWRPQLGPNAIAWREMHIRRSRSKWALLGRILLWIAVAASLVVVGWQYLEYLGNGQGDAFIGFVFWFNILLSCCGLVLIAARASNSIAAERESDTWTMLISTPLSGSVIYLGKLLGAIYGARVVLVPLALSWLLAMVAQPRFIVALAMMLVSMAVLAVSCSVLGLSLSLWSPNSTRALGFTLGICFSVFTISLCCYFPFGFVNPAFLIGALPAGVHFFAGETKQFEWIVAVGAAVCWLIGICLHSGGAALMWYTTVQGFDRSAGRAVIPFSGIIPTGPQSPFAAPEPTPAAPPAAS